MHVLYDYGICTSPHEYVIDDRCISINAVLNLSCMICGFFTRKNFWFDDVLLQLQWMSVHLSHLCEISDSLKNVHKCISLIVNREIQKDDEEKDNISILGFRLNNNHD